MVVGTGALAYKLGSSQKQQIEQVSGVPIEEMTDDEINQVVKEHNIPVEQLSESDQANVKTAGPVEEYEDDEGDDEEHEEEAEPGGDYTAELEKLADLHSKGILTDEEFTAKKKQILGL